MKRTGVTRLLLWEEYIRENPTGLQYSRFCKLLQDHIRVTKAVMHFEHQPARMMQVDFAGDQLYYVDPSTGELVGCPVLVFVLPFSGYGYVEALPNMKLVQVVKALNNALDYFGGVPLGAKSDNMKQWVSRSSRYEPVFTDMLEQWANHNHIALYASRPYKPKDKAPVENFVKITYRRVYAHLRNHTFHNLAELNRAIKEMLALHHQMNFQKKTFSRLELFTGQEAQHLQPLPETPYQIRHYTKAKVQKNYHVVIGEDWHFYSVPFRYIGKEVRIAYCEDIVEIYRAAAAMTTSGLPCTAGAIKVMDIQRSKNICPMPIRLCQDNRDGIRNTRKAAENGPCTYQLFKKVMDSKLIIDQSYASCLGLLRLIKAYGAVRMENTCKRALTGYKFSYGAVKSILDNNMDQAQQTTAKEYRIPEHPNLRGPGAYEE